MTGQRLFILVDQSIKDLGGHHFEYAERILNAARAKGYDTLLLAHNDFKEHAQSTHRVISCFRRTFWENFAPPLPVGKSLLSLRARAARAKASFATWKRNQGLAWTYSRPGYYFLWAWDAMRHDPSAPLFSSAGLAPDSNRHLAIFARLFWMIWFRIKRSRWARSAGRMITAAARVLGRALLGIAAIALAPFTLLWDLIGSRKMLESPAQAFNADLIQGLKTIDPDKTGYIFVPTLHTAELEGIRQFLLDRPDYQRIPWGLLYRRNIFDGLPAEYREQIEGIRPLRVAFTRVRETLPDARLTFFTDTQELTDQYNLLNTFEFATVPVPSDFTTADRASRKAKADAADAPLTLSFLGDARDEKGYGLLLESQRILADKYLIPGRAKFLLQSNFNVPNGEPRTAIAHRMLRDCFHEGVELIYGPFDRGAYRDLIARTDIMLIPYDRRNYAARSSGVFAESVAAGIPSIVPGGSWMASVLHPYQQRHLDRIFPVDGEPDAKTGPYGARLLNSFEAPAEFMANGGFVSMPEGCTYIVLSVAVPGVDSAYVDCWLTKLNEAASPAGSGGFVGKYTAPSSRIPFKVEHAPSIWIRAKIVASKVSLAHVSIRIDCYATDGSAPLSAGSVVCSLDGGGLSDGIVEMIEHYDHYSSSAKEMSDELRWLYDPALLVERLEEAAGSGAVEQAKAS